MPHPNPRSLAERFAALHAEREHSWPREKLQANIAQRRALLDGFDPAASIGAGDRMPPFTLESVDGTRLDLDTLIADGPALLIVFRFAGCPACNIALSYYQEALLPGLVEAGVRVVGVSPHLPEKGLGDIRTQHDLGFEIASDRGNGLGRRLGLTFLPLGHPPAASEDPNWIGALTGTGSWELPMPALILVDRDGIVRYANISPDWMARPEARAVLDAVAALRLPEDIR